VKGCRPALGKVRLVHKKKKKRGGGEKGGGETKPSRFESFFLKEKKKKKGKGKGRRIRWTTKA